MRNQLSDFEIIESEEDISSLTEAKLSEPNKELQFVTWSYDETKKTDWQAVATGTTLDQYHYFCYRYDPWTTIFTNDLAKRSYQTILSCEQCILFRSELIDMKACEDTNECYLDNECHENSCCRNTHGTYTCECQPGQGTKNNRDR